MTRLLPLMMVGIAFTGLAMMAQAEAINVPAPDFTLESRSGENLRLEDHRGEVVMLNFWMVVPVSVVFRVLKLRLSVVYIYIIVSSSIISKILIIQQLKLMLAILLLHHGMTLLG